MSTRYPGARWIPAGDAGAMTGLRGCSLHIAVTRGTPEDIAGWVRSAKSCHAYNGKDGDFAQYMDIGRRAYGVKDGNHNMLTVESYDGLQIKENPYREVGIGGVYGTDANNGRWDAGQCERMADFAAWLNIEHGIPLQVMPDSKPNSRGFGPHRLGINPWRVPGGEVWTSMAGKQCPGDLRVQQIPGIVERAKVIAAAIKAGKCGYLPAGVVNVAAALARTGGKPGTTTPTPSTRPTGGKQPAGAIAFPLGPGALYFGPKGGRNAVSGFPGTNLMATDLAPRVTGWIKAIQSAAGVRADGFYGDRTKAAVAAWQRQRGLDGDGLVGWRTWEKMGLRK